MSNYDANKKISGLDIETVVADADIFPFGDTSDNGKAKGITLEDLQTQIGADVVAARAYKSSAVQSIPNGGVNTLVTLDAETYDTDGNFATNRFTATVEGYYVVAGSVYYQDVEDTINYSVLIYKNGGASTIAGTIAGGAGSKDMVANCSDVIFLEVGDYLELYTNHFGVGSKNVKNVESSSFLAVARLASGGGGGSGADEKVKASTADTTPSFLNNKIEMTSDDDSVAIAASIVNPGANEKLKFDLSVSLDSGGGGGTKILIDTDEVTNTGDTDENTIFSVSIPAYTLGNNNAFRFKIFGIQNTVTTASATFRMKYGGTTIGTLIATGNGNDRNFVIKGIVIADNANNAQKGNFEYSELEEGQDVGFTLGGIQMPSGSAAVDSTLDQTLEITVEFDDASCSNTGQAIIVEKISGIELTLSKQIDFTALYPLDGAGDQGSTLNGYADREVYIVANTTRTNLLVDDPNGYLRKLAITDIWVDAEECTGFALIGPYLYLLLCDSSISTYRLYRVTYADFSVFTNMTIAGTAFGTATGASKMTSDGTSLYFSFDAGRDAANSYEIAEYSVSGTTATYVSTVTLAGTPTIYGFAVTLAGGYIGVQRDISDSGVGDIFYYDDAGVELSTFEDIGSYFQTVINIATTMYIGRNGAADTVHPQWYRVGYAN